MISVNRHFSTLLCNNSYNAILFVQKIRDKIYNYVLHTVAEHSSYTNIHTPSHTDYLCKQIYTNTSIMDRIRNNVSPF